MKVEDLNIGNVVIQNWHSQIETAVAGSILAVDKRFRESAVLKLLDAGCAIHLDFIIGNDGEHHGIHPAELTYFLKTFPDAMFDLHLIVGEKLASHSSGITADRAIKKLFFSLIGAKISHLTVDKSTYFFESELIARLRESGIQIWLEFSLTDDLLQIPKDADGVLLMFITSGTREEAKPDRIELIPGLAKSWPVGIDGGINPKIARDAVNAGASYIVAGRSLLNQTTEII